MSPNLPGCHDQTAKMKYSYGHHTPSLCHASQSLSTGRNRVSYISLIPLLTGDPVWIPLRSRRSSGSSRGCWGPSMDRPSIPAFLGFLPRWRPCTGLSPGSSLFAAHHRLTMTGELSGSWASLSSFSSSSGLTCRRDQPRTHTSAKHTHTRTEKPVLQILFMDKFRQHDSMSPLTATAPLIFVTVHVILRPPRTRLSAYSREPLFGRINIRQTEFRTCETHLSRLRRSSSDGSPRSLSFRHSLMRRSSVGRRGERAGEQPSDDAVGRGMEGGDPIA